MRRARLRRRFLRGAALTALLWAVGCQSFLDSESHEELKREAGFSCEDGVQCASGFCVDNFCCDTRCDGQCDACSADKNVNHTDGQCGPVVDWHDLFDGCGS